MARKEETLASRLCWRRPSLQSADRTETTVSRVDGGQPLIALLSISIRRSMLVTRVASGVSLTCAQLATEKNLKSCARKKCRWHGTQTAQSWYLARDDRSQGVELATCTRVCYIPARHVLVGERCEGVYKMTCTRRLEDSAEYRSVMYGLSLVVHPSSSTHTRTCTYSNGVLAYERCTHV